jgi:putative restriction endonuclease
MLANKSLQTENSLLIHRHKTCFRRFTKMKQTREKWTREQLIVAFNLYCRTPFGRIHKSNPMIMELANKIGRTPSAVAMKMVNFASLDPAHRLRHIKGLEHASKEDERIWEEFHKDWQRLASESQRAIRQLSKRLEQEEVYELPEVSVTEVERSMKVRLVQKFFRDTVLASYNYACTMCDLRVISMLNASHIIPWSVDSKRRADPRNGLGLCVFHDRAFDRGLISIDENYRIVVSRKVKVRDAPELHKVGLLDVEGRQIRLPERFLPDNDALSYHRENVFVRL